VRLLPGSRLHAWVLALNCADSAAPAVTCPRLASSLDMLLCSVSMLAFQCALRCRSTGPGAAGPSRSVHKVSAASERMLAIHNEMKAIHKVNDLDASKNTMTVAEIRSALMACLEAYALLPPQSR
jgi:hypothetical protein